MTVPDTTVDNGKLRITHVSIDLTLGLYAFTYASGIQELLTIKDVTEVPTVEQLLVALTAEVEKFGRPQKAPGDGDTPPAAGPTR